MKQDFLRFLLSIAVIYYAVMIIIYLNQEVFFNPGDPTLGEMEPESP
jgi:hypothetical protein